MGYEIKSSQLHQAFFDLYVERWDQHGGTLLAFSEACGVRRETLRGWLTKEKIELLEHLESALDALGAEIVVKKRKKSKVVPVDRRRTAV
ncbi:MAG: hypothetical protein ACYTF0_07750 [Planctomycetota bacterium]|jgi:hypothetical protein